MVKEEKILSADDLAAEPVEIVKVELDDKGGVMFIGSLTADQFVEWQDARNATSEAKRNAASQLIVDSLVKGEKDPTRIGTPEMLPFWRKVRVMKSERMLKAIFKLNGINQPDDLKNA